MFFEFFKVYLEGDAVGSTKSCARVCYHKMPCMTKIIQKLGHQASNLCLVGGRILNMDSSNLRDIWLLDKKRWHLVEWDTFILWLLIACNRQNRCDKSTVQRFGTAIARAIGQQKRSAIDWFWNNSVPFFVLKACTLFIPIFWGSSYHDMIVGQGPKMVRKSKPNVNMTEHDRQKRALGFPVRHNASQNKSLQNEFPIFECQMECRYRMQCTPFNYKNWCTGPFFLTWILHETGDGIKHVFTLYMVEMVRGIIDCVYTGQSPDAQSPNTRKVTWAWRGGYSQAKPD